MLQISKRIHLVVLNNNIAPCSLLASSSSMLQISPIVCLCMYISVFLYTCTKTFSSHIYLSGGNNYSKCSENMHPGCRLGIFEIHLLFLQLSSCYRVINYTNITFFKRTPKPIFVSFLFLVFVFLDISSILCLSFSRLCILQYTIIFLTNRLRLVYYAIPWCLPLMYPGWDQKSEFLPLLTMQQLWCGIAVGYCSTTANILQYPAAKDL